MASEKVILVGAGAIAESWIPPLKKEQTEIIGIVDLDLAKAEKLKSKFNLEAVCSDNLEAMLDDYSPDFLMDLTIPEAHCEVTCTALRRRIPVLSEKPMASSMEEARKMVQAAEEHNTLYMVSQSRRWVKPHAQLLTAIKAGAIGNLTTLHADFFIGAHFGGFRDAMVSPLILDMAIHLFDLARFFSGKDPVAVYAQEFNPQGSWYQGDASATCIFEMEDGVNFNFRGSWCSEGCHTDWNGDWRILGSKGTLLYQGGSTPTGEAIVNDEGFHRELAPIEIPELDMPREYFHQGLHEMLTALRTNTPPATECHDNIKSLAMVFAAIESSRRQERVEVTW